MSAERTCQCGCGEVIPELPHHKYRPPKYLPLHFQRASKAGRKTLIPPRDWEVPDGTCKCGCGQSTTVATQSSRRRDEYKGFFKRYVSGHNINTGTGPKRYKVRGDVRKESATTPIEVKIVNSYKTKGLIGGHLGNSGGYINLYCPTHPNARRDGTFFEHRLIMELTLGRFLEPHERVHHLNGVRYDNRPENLELWKIGKKDPAGVRATDYHCAGCRCFDH